MSAPVPHSRLLAVDDDVSSAELVVRLAERCRYEAFATSDSRGVMNLVSALNPEVLAIDVEMPNINAYDLMTLLASAEFKGGIVVISGQDIPVLESVRAHGQKLGLNEPHIMRKPIETRALREILIEYATRERRAA